MESTTPNRDSLLDTAKLEQLPKVRLNSVLLDSYYSPKYALKILSVYAIYKAKLRGHKCSIHRLEILTKMNNSVQFKGFFSHLFYPSAHSYNAILLTALWEQSHTNHKYVP